MSINLLDNNYLLENGYIMQTKKGTAWRCGKGYRKDWTKLIGKEVLLHSKPYTLTNRVKKNGKWYLVYTDGTNNYTELQSKALHNKGMAKDTIIEAVKRVIAGLLTAPKELIDQILEQANTCIKLYNSTVTDIDLLEPTWEQTIDECNPVWIQDPVNLFEVKIQVIAGGIACGLQNMPTIYRRLIQYYHPDHNNYPTEYLEQVKTLRYMF